MARSHVKITVPVDSTSARKQREVANHIGGFVDNKKLQIKGLRVVSISIEYESVK